MTGASLELTFSLAGENAFIRCWPGAKRNILGLASFSQCPCSGSLGVLFSDPCCSVRTLLLLYVPVSAVARIASVALRDVLELA